MTTTISVTTAGQVVLPRKFCQRKKFKPGASVRVTEIGDGFYLTPVPEPTEQELKAVLASAGSLTRRQTPSEEAMVEQIVSHYRTEKRRKSG